MTRRVADGATIDETARVGDGTRVWHLAQIREEAVLGDGCIVGRGAYVGTGVRIGHNVKIQNYALIYDPAVIEDGVFIGPAAVLTNDRHPRAISPDGTRKDASDWEPAGVTLRRGASVGAAAVVLPGITIGPWAMVGANATVTRDVPAHALVAGTPARRIGWVGRMGHLLDEAGDGRWRCPASGEEYLENGHGLSLARGAHR